MENWIKYLEILGTLFQFIGAYLLYKNSTGSKPKVLATFTDDDPDKFKKINQHFMNDPSSQFKAGFLVLAIGLFMTLVSTILK